LRSQLLRITGLLGCITREWQRGTKSAKAEESQEEKEEGQAMRRGEKSDTAELKVTFEVLAGRQGGRRIFAIKDEAEEIARQTKLAHMVERIAAYDRGYEGNRRRCPQCGQWQKYKGERARELVFDCGLVTVQRAYYVCPACGETRCLLDEKLGLVEGKEQGRLREKLAVLAVLTPYIKPRKCVRRCWGVSAMP
jgi:predicted RNA-binding Zn-ribbon protein involved in translation (DUF1610 family)